MKLSLLQIVQSVLNDNDGDEVNSIDDTVEATQAAHIVRDTYNDIVTNSEIEYFRRAIQLDGVSDQRYPNYLKLPTNIQEMVWISYDRAKKDTERSNYTRLTYLYPDEFLHRANQLNNTKDDVIEVRDFDGMVYSIQTNKGPDYWTSFDDEFIVLDSYDKNVETTVHKNKNQAVAFVTPDFDIRDDFIPDLPADMFPYLISESKAQFSAKIRQVVSQKDEQWSATHRRRMSRKSWQAKGGIRLPNYGRVGYAQRRNPYFDKSY